jgi:rhodanese-related sulfurtransferase
MNSKTALTRPKKSFLEQLRITVLGLSGKLPAAPAEEIVKWIKNGAVLVDVRTNFEARKDPMPGATNIPLAKLEGELSRLPPGGAFVTFCRRGGRAERAKNLLEANGRKAINGGGYKSLLKVLQGIESGHVEPAARRT